jgi:hypothetical protein
MRNELKKLEETKSELAEKIKKLGDFRRGYIGESYNKCGKKNCACASKGHPGHGPRYYWSTTIKGKSSTKTLKVGPEMEKYRKEIENCRKYEVLSKSFLELSEQICDLRPIIQIEDASELERLKKKLQRIYKAKCKRK